MDLELLRVHNHGRQDEEYVLLRATEDCNLVNYMLADTTYFDDETISNRLRHLFWFPSHEVEAGDLVSVRTGHGTNTITSNKNGETIHRFYWGLSEPVWNDTGDAALLVELSDWSFIKAQE